MAVPVGVLFLHISLGDTRTLKEKRSIIQPIIHQLRKEFNLSVAETDLLERHSEAEITCCMVANDRAFLQQALRKVIAWIEESYRHIEILEYRIELR